MPDRGAAHRRRVRYGWAPLAALAVTTALESGERQSLSQAVHGIQHDFHVTDSALGLLAFAMAIVAVVGSFPVGILTDRMRRTWLLAGAVAVWTACMGFNAIATSYALLFVARLGVGAVEANGPAAVSLLSDYYPVKDRARMMGLYQGGALVGALVGLLGGGVAVAIGGWRWAFLMWIPFGIAGTLFLLRQPEPVRGEQDESFHGDTPDAVDGLDGEALDLSALPLVLPDPPRVGTLDYRTCTPRDVGRELLRIRSMWFGVFSLTISQLLLNGLQFWGVEYYKRVHHLSAASAGAVTALLGAGSVFGILGGGVLADRLLARGVVNARVYVVAYGSMAATAVLAPAFATTSLLLSAPLMFVGGALLTLPVAPAEALVSDVVVADLRGRAATVRSVVRGLSAIGPLLIGVLADAMGLRLAIVALTPLYAAGGLVMLAAARHYPSDVAFVVAETARLRRLREGEETAASGANTGGRDN